LEDRIVPNAGMGLGVSHGSVMSALHSHAHTSAGAIVTETEPPGSHGLNDTQPTAQYLGTFGTGAGHQASIDVAGVASPVPPSVPSHEDDGAIPLANATGLTAGQSGQVTASATIGDGPNGSTGTRKGDYDYYRVPALANQLLTVNVYVSGSALNSVVAIYNSAGTLLALNDDKFDNPFYGFSRGSYLRFLAPASDIYYVAVFGSGPQANPFQSASGGGAASEGPYTLSVLLESPSVIQPREDDGSISLAEPSGLTLGPGGTAYVSGDIGDGPHGSVGNLYGDFDFYAVPAAAGQTITADVDAVDPNAPGYGLDTIAAIYNSAGQQVAFNDDDNQTGNSFISFVAPATDTYYVMVGAFSPAAGVEGPYTLILRVGTAPVTDVDYYSFDLAAGDVVGANLSGGAGQLRLYQPDGTLLVGSNVDAAGFYSAASPLPVGGNASLGYVINTPGRYALAVVGGETVAAFGFGSYTLELRDFRPALEQQPVYTHQVLFLDFDGATLDVPAVYGFGDAHAHLSPLASFLPNWGLGAADENAVIDAIDAQVARSVAQDVSGVVGRGRNGDFSVTGRAGDFQIEILNSRDNADPFGVYPNVSRVVVGGTQVELGWPFFPFILIGIGQSVDVGNFDTADQALVLLDILSDTDPTDPFSLNVVPRAPGASMVDLIGAQVGIVVAHEFGHISGNWHIDLAVDTTDNIMNPVPKLDLGPDGIFGTPDDVTRRFGLGHYFAAEGPYSGGIEDTLNDIAFGLSTGKQAGTYFDFVTGTLYVSGSIDDGRKDDLQVKTVGSNLQVFINGRLALTRPAAGVNRVVLNGSSDDDTLDGSAYSGSAILLGRVGKDVLLGGTGNDVLVGGDGDDQLTAGSGRDVLIGGRGVDHLTGGRGGDLLIGGFTAFDADITALAAISSEWSSNRSYGDRVANLRGTGNGPRANGNDFLIASGIRATVFDDDAEDILIGGLDRDWYFARLTGNKKDHIVGLTSGELIDGL
jgi:hypothetical protein